MDKKIITAIVAIVAAVAIIGGAAFVMMNNNNNNGPDAKNASEKIVNELNAICADGNVATFSVAEGANADSASITEVYQGRTGETTVTSIIVKKTSNAKADYDAAVTELNTHIGEKAYMAKTYAAYSAPAIEGISYTIITESSSSASHYMKFTMQIGDYIIDGYSGQQNYLPKTDFENPEDLVKAIMKALQ